MGNLNKIPTALGSYALFRDSNLASPCNVASVALGVVGGVVFVFAKGAAAPLQSSTKGTQPAKGALPLKDTGNGLEPGLQLMRQESYMGHQRKPNPFRIVPAGWLPLDGAPSLQGVLRPPSVQRDMEGGGIGGLRLP